MLLKCGWALLLSIKLALRNLKLFKLLRNLDDDVLWWWSYQIRWMRICCGNISVLWFILANFQRGGTHWCDIIFSTYFTLTECTILLLIEVYIKIICGCVCMGGCYNLHKLKIKIYIYIQEILPLCPFDVYWNGHLMSQYTTQYLLCQDSKNWLK